MLLDESSLPEGPSVKLRHLDRDSSFDCYESWINDPEVLKWLVVRFEFEQTRKELLEYVEQCNQDPTCTLLGVYEKSSNCHIGNLKLLAMDFVHGFCDLSLVIGSRNHAGKGFGKQTVALGVSIAFNLLGLRRVEAGGMQPNIASETIFRRCGFQAEGISRARHLVNGEPIDCWRVGLLTTDPPLWEQWIMSKP